MEALLSKDLHWGRAIDGLRPRVTHIFPQRSDLLSEGQTVEHAFILLDGAACRYKMMGEGRRVIVGIVLPGDFATPVNVVGQADFGIAALTDCEVLEIPVEVLRSHAATDLDLARLLERAALVEGAMLRSWLANLSQQASQRVAHLLCELRHRLAIVKLASTESFRLPLKQWELADAMGCSSVHINRVMQELRMLDLIRTKGHLVVIPDLHRLETFAGFNSAYLHFGEAEQSNDVIEAEVHRTSARARAAQSVQPHYAVDSLLRE